MVWLIHLLAYVWLVPPWQHYDEPTHFEYVALIRELGRVPTADEQIPALRRAVAASMIASGFYTQRAIPLPPPDLAAPDLSLGVNERGHPPLYYILAALATAPLRHASITNQLYGARLFSVVLACALFIACYGVLRMLTQDKALRCVTLAVLVLNPAFADIMSAVNSDALANLVGVLCLAAGVWFVQRPGWNRLLAGLVIVVVAYNVKRVLMLYALVVPCAWLCVMPRRFWRGAIAIGAVATVIAGVWLLVQPWPLADWGGPTASSYASTRLLQRFQHNATTQGARPYAGAVAFALATRPGEAPPMLSQRVYAAQLRELTGTLTLAAWMRADRPLRAATPILLVDGVATSQHVQLDTHWQLVTHVVTLSRQPRTLEVQLVGVAAPGMVWYDALALVRGGSSYVPRPDEPDGSFEPGLLHDNLPRNLLRNAGAEEQIPPLPSVVQASGDTGLARALAKLFNPSWIAVVYPQQAVLLFQGFWGTFGWGERSMQTGWFAALGCLVVASLAGAARLSWQAWQSRPPLATTPLWCLCLLAVALGWGAALLRVNSQPFPGAMFWSFGRYAFVALLPSLLVFVAGLRAILPPGLRRQGMAGVMLFLLVYALAALLGTVSAY